jgi:hypothetical protein
VGELGIGWERAARRSRTLTLMRSTGDAVGMETLDGNMETKRMCPICAWCMWSKSTHGGSNSGLEQGQGASHQRHGVPRCRRQLVFVD